MMQSRDRTVWRAPSGRTERTAMDGAILDDDAPPTTVYGCGSNKCARIGALTAVGFNCALTSAAMRKPFCVALRRSLMSQNRPAGLLRSNFNNGHLLLVKGPKKKEK